MRKYRVVGIELIGYNTYIYKIQTKDHLLWHDLDGNPDSYNQPVFYSGKEAEEMIEMIRIVEEPGYKAKTKYDKIKH